MRTQYKPMVIFSVERHDLSYGVNVRNKLQVESEMRAMGIDFERVLGVYKGNEETSYIVTDMDKLPIIVGMAKEHNQESILLRDNENKCVLAFFNGEKSMSIGKMTQVSVDEALLSDCYTYSYSLKQYFDLL